MTNHTANAADGKQKGGVLSGAYDRTAETASSAYEATKAGTEDVHQAHSGDAMDAAPLAVVAGGVAVGVLAGMLMPRTARETDLLGATGKRLNAAAVAAVKTARKVGMDELAAQGISRDAAHGQVSKLFDGASEGCRKRRRSGGRALRSTRQSPKKSS